MDAWHPGKSLRDDGQEAAIALRELSVPSDRSIRWVEPDKLDQEAIDDLILKAHFVSPVWSDYALVAERPSIWELAGHAANHIDDWIILVADDSLIAVSERSTDVLMTVSPVAVGDTIQYQISLHAFVMSESVFHYAPSFHSFAHSYGLLQFPDSSIIDRHQVTSTGEQAAAYLADSERRRPLFIFRRQTMLSTRGKRFQRAAKFVFSGFGTIVTSDALFRAYRGVVSDPKFGVIAVAPDGSAMSIEPGGSMFPRLARFLEGCNLQESLQPSDEQILNSFAESAWLPRPHTPIRLEVLRQIGEEYQGFWGVFLARMAAVEVAEPDRPPTLLITDYADQIVVEPREPRPLKLDADGYPVETSGIAQWADLRFAGNIVLLPRARRAIDKVRHPEPRRIAQALEALAGPKLRGYRGEAETHIEFEAALMNLRLRDGFSNAERLKGQTGEAYVIQYEGRRLLLQRHLCSNSSGFNDPRMIRIYYVYDKLTQKIIVGWLPTHLPNSQS